MKRNRPANHVRSAGSRGKVTEALVDGPACADVVEGPGAHGPAISVVHPLGPTDTPASAGHARPVQICGSCLIAGARRRETELLRYRGSSRRH